MAWAPDLALQTVGVAGFEPTASSSRSNFGAAATGVLLRCRPADASQRVRESPHPYAVVVTQFVTHATLK